MDNIINTKGAFVLLASTLTAVCKAHSSYCEVEVRMTTSSSGDVFVYAPVGALDKAVVARIYVGYYPRRDDGKIMVMDRKSSKIFSEVSELISVALWTVNAELSQSSVELVD